MSIEAMTEQLRKGSEKMAERVARVRSRDIPAVGDYITDNVLSCVSHTDFCGYIVREVDEQRRRCFYSDFLTAPVSVCVDFSALSKVGSLCLGNSKQSHIIWVVRDNP